MNGCQSSRMGLVGRIVGKSTFTGTRFKILEHGMSLNHFCMYCFASSTGPHDEDI